MKLTKAKLQKIIKEELDNMMAEESSDIAQKYPEHYDFLLSALEKGHVGDNRSEKYMTLVSWLTRGAITDLEAVEDNEARKLIDAAKEESNRVRWERDRKWKEENPDTRTPEERQADADRGEAAYHAAERAAGRNPTYGT